MRPSRHSTHVVHEHILSDGLRSHMRQTVHVHDRDRAGLRPDKALVAKLTKCRADRLTAAADAVGDLLVSQRHAEANAAIVRNPVGLPSSTRRRAHRAGTFRKIKSNVRLRIFRSRSPTSLVSLKVRS